MYVMMGMIKIEQVFALGCYLFECIMISAKPANTCLIVGAPVEFYVVPTIGGDIEYCLTAEFQSYISQ